MTTEQLKRHVDIQLARMEGKINTILQLVIEQVSDPLSIADLQRRLNDSQQALRRLEYDEFFKTVTNCNQLKGGEE